MAVVAPAPPTDNRAMSTLPQPDTRQAWWRLLATLLLMTVGSAGMYVVSVMLPAVQADFGVTRAQASLPYTTLMIGFGLGCVLGGKLADRYGIVPVILLGAVSLGVGAHRAIVRRRRGRHHRHCPALTASWRTDVPPSGLRQLEVESGALPGRALGPGAAAHALHRLGHDGQADAGAGVVLGAVQALEDLEDAVVEAHVEAHAVRSEEHT